jgi:U4/U6.U5 tri-snRNP-associated protein 3
MTERTETHGRRTAADFMEHEDVKRQTSKRYSSSSRSESDRRRSRSPRRLHYRDDEYRRKRVDLPYDDKEFRDDRGRYRERERDKRDRTPNNRSADRENGKRHGYRRQERDNDRETQHNSEHVTEELPESVDEQDEMMRKMMGFSGFDTTKNKKVAGANTSAVSKPKSSSYRQYMNRVGGFNRELSPPPDERGGQDPPERRLIPHNTVRRDEVH